MMVIRVFGETPNTTRETRVLPFSTSSLRLNQGVNENGAEVHGFEICAERRVGLVGRSKTKELERFHKCCSGVLFLVETAVFLIFGVVSTQSQGFSNLLLRRSLAKNQKSSLHTATSFLSTL